MANVFSKSNHQQILHYLKGINLGDKCDNGRTVLANLMHDVTNGDRIVRQKLDECITETTKDENDPEHSIVVDLNPLRSSHKSNNSMTDKGGQSTISSSVVRDLIDFRHTAANNLLCHPVIETYMNFRWFTMRHFFFINSVLFLLTFAQSPIASG